MTVSSLGDLAYSFALQKRSVDLRTNIMRYNDELTTGMTARVVDHLGGSYAQLTDIENDLRRVESFRVISTEASTFASAIQGRLGQIADISSEMSTNLLIIDNANTAAARATAARSAEDQLDAIVTALNSEIAGRSLFAGISTDVEPLVDGNTILTAAQGVVAGATDIATIETALDTWLADPAGFDAVAYQGNTTPLSPFRISEEQSISFETLANDPVLKDVMKGVIMTTLTNFAGVTLDALQEDALVRRSAEVLRGAGDNLVELRADVGFSESIIDRERARIATENSALENAKGSLLEIDPYEAATRLEAAQFQLESLYAVTVRSSELRLVNFLR